MSTRPGNAQAGAGTTDALRDAIDHGRTGDKVDYSDPAAAPLGTDAEAGGAVTWEAELTDDGDAEDRPNDTNNSSNAAVWIVLGLAIVFGAIIVLVAS